MNNNTLLLNSLFSALPAFLFGVLVLTLSRDEYYWLTYAIMSLVFISASVILGLILPTKMQYGCFNYPWLWLFIAGGLAWLIALLSLALLNFTPLCVGQENGDGTNNLSLCAMYTLLVVFLYSPVEFVLLTLSAFVGGICFVSAKVK
jgi:hypothetical protein